MKACVVGTTSWGTTLAILLAKNHVNTCLLTRTSTETTWLNESRENQRFLPGANFPLSLRVTNHVDEALKEAHLVIMAVPSQTIRKNAKLVAEYIRPTAVVVSASKGIELDSAKRMSEILLEEIPHASEGICVLSGPNLAREIAQGKPAPTVVASRNEEAALLARDALMCSALRVYTNEDVIGVEMGGALKNIIAIGAGICDGLELGDNAKAGFIARGLAEISRLGVAAGANSLTLSGLAGLGDLVATCYSSLSRNRYVGEELGKGADLVDILDSMENVAEGVPTTGAVLDMASRLGIEMPITEITKRILFDKLLPIDAAAELMGRAPKSE